MCHPNVQRIPGSWEHWVVLPPLAILVPSQEALSSHPNTRHCLGIHVTLAEELGAVPPPPHAWTVPQVEDMLHYTRMALMEAVVTGPGRAVLFYGRHSLGEGLSLDKTRMLHSDLLKWVHGLGNQPILLLTLWQSQKVVGNHPGHIQMLGKGKRARASVHESVDPTTI